MWTFEILNKTKTDENTIELVVEFTKGANTFKRTFYVRKGQATRLWLEGEIKREINEFENRKTFNQEIKEGVFTLTPDPVSPTPIPVPAPTQDELDRTLFIEKVNALARMQKLVNLGIIQSSAMTTLRDEVITLYKPEWIDKIVF